MTDLSNETLIRYLAAIVAALEENNALKRESLKKIDDFAKTVWDTFHAINTTVYVDPAHKIGDFPDL